MQGKPWVSGRTSLTAPYSIHPFPVAQRRASQSLICRKMFTVVSSSAEDSSNHCASEMLRSA
jgi:hypothetical protein